MTKVATTDNENVENLKNLIEKAEENGVAPQYMEKAQKLSSQMNGNIKARDILQMMLDYPEREYPVIEVVDPKKRKPAPKKEEEKKKKRKKKEPPFLIPEWAAELEALITQVKNMESLVADAENLSLD